MSSLHKVHLLSQSHSINRLRWVRYHSEKWNIKLVHAQPSDEEPLVVTVGESTTATVNQSDWPESQWVVTLPHLPPSGKLRIAVKCGTAQTEIWVEPGRLLHGAHSKYNYPLAIFACSTGQQDHCGVWNIDELLR